MLYCIDYACIKKAKIIFKHNYFEIVEKGDYVLCAISGKKINLQNLNYWNVELQEAYYSPKEVIQRYKLQKNNFISIYHVSKSIDLDCL